jgi:uncharacterized membrane protein (DUF4010 family)
MVAGLLAFALGAYAVLGSRLAAGSAAVAATFILAERQALHGFVERLTWPELRSSLLLLIMTVVFLPVLPNRTIDPWGAFNPFQIWLITVIIGAVSFVGYVAVRLAGTRNGLLYAGVAGGLVSSTTVTWRFAALARHETALQSTFVAGIAASWCVSLVRTLTIAFVMSPMLGLSLAKPLGFALIVVAAASATFYRFAERGGQAPVLKLDNPFDIGETLRFGALLATVLFASKWAVAVIGSGGLIALGSLSGLADVDPITLSMGQAAGHGVGFGYAAVIVLVATAANTLTRCVLAWSFGGVRLGAIMTAIACAGAVAVLIGLLV